MDNQKTVLWDDSWHAKSWEGGHGEISSSAPCWEYGGFAGMKLTNDETSPSSSVDED
jgi:hypothetical protein